MNYKGHIFVGLCFSAAALNFGIVDSIVSDALSKTICSTGFLISSFNGLLLPDIDHPGSHIGRRHKIISIIIERLSRPAHSKKGLALKRRPVYVGHRGPMHSIFIWLLLFSIMLLPSVILDNQLAVSLFFCIASGTFTGALSHLFADLPDGIPLLYPLTRKKISLFKYPFANSHFIVFILTIMLLLWSLLFRSC